MVLAVPQNVMPPNNGVVPCEGPRVIPTTLDFSKSSSYTFDLTGPFQQQQLSTCQCLYIDNSGAGAAAIVITINGSNQTLTIEPGTCGYYNIMMVNPPVLTLVSSNSTAKVYVAAMNFYIPGTVWGAGGSGAWTKIASASPTGTNTVTFSSIPGTYSHLYIVGQGRSTTTGTGGAFVNLQFNGDTGANYASQRIGANGSSTPFADQTSAQTSINGIGEMPFAGDIANYPGSFEAIIQFYAGTTFNKTVHMTWNNFINTLVTSLFTLQGAGAWNSTAAITSITLTLSSGNFVTGSTLTLYGIS